MSVAEKLGGQCDAYIVPRRANLVSIAAVFDRIVDGKELLGRVHRLC